MGVTGFGYFLSGEELSPAKVVETAQQAERAGFERVWISDQFHPWMQSQGENPFVWAALGAIAAGTGLQMTTAVTCPTFRIHPAVIAQAAATVAPLAEGRFTRRRIGRGAQRAYLELARAACRRFSCRRSAGGDRGRSPPR
jgi:G6PDH family F420-dependent oxidoreductase